jgi:hypothetical protein
MAPYSSYWTRAASHPPNGAKSPEAHSVLGGDRQHEIPRLAVPVAAARTSGRLIVDADERLSKLRAADRARLGIIDERIGNEVIADRGLEPYAMASLAGMTLCRSAALAR